MPLIYVLPISLAVFLLIQFLLIGAIDKRLRKEQTAGKLALAGSLALLKTVRQFAILAVLVYSTIWICVSLGSFAWTQDAESFGKALGRLSHLREGMEGFFSVWNRVLASFLIILLGFTYYIRRKRSLRTEMRTAFQAAAIGVIPDIQAESEGEKQPMAPSERMLECAAKIRQIDETIATTLPESARQQLYQIRAQLQEQMLLLDVDRRLGAEFDAVPSLKRRRGWAGLLNQGLLDDLKGLPKLASLVGNALLLVSLLSLNAPGVTTEIAARTAKLSQSQIRATLHEQKEELKDIGLDPDPQSPNAAQPSQPLSPQDERTIQRAAAYYERAFSGSRIFEAREHPESALPHQSKENLVRDAILSDSSSAESGEHTAAGASEFATAEGPATRTGYHFAEDLRASFRAAPEKLKQRFRTKFASYGEPIQPLSAEQFVISQLFGEGVDGTLNTHGFMTDQAKEFVKDFGGDEIKEAYSRVRDEMFAGAYGSDTAADALKRVSNPKRAFVRADNEAAVRQAIVQSSAKAGSDDVFGKHPPSATAAAEDNPEVVQLVKDLNAVRGGRAEPLTDPLLAYNDIAPEAVGAEMSTSRGILNSALQGAVQGAEESAFRFTVGRSFGMLAGSFRVGGVLIGIDPPAAKVDFRDIGWAMDRDRIQLSLIGANGTPVSVGSFPKATVRLALNYAADGRPLAATMVSAPPLYDLKILAHPALVDTVLGARIIEMDRYVDRFTATDEQRRKAEELIYSQNALYELAWYTRESVVGIGGAELRETRSGMAAEDAVSALSSAETFKDRKTSLLLAKTEFYDQDLVAAMTRCPKTSIPAFTACIEGRYKGSNAQQKWAGQPPAFQIWSGVRELPYTPGQDLNFLLRRTDELFPFTFLVQVAFTTEPQFAQNTGAGYADTTPFEISSLTDRIRAAVTRGISTNPDEKTSFEAVKEFAILQRLFRLALKGGLGSQFPIEKLVTLKRSVLSSPVACRTPRWNPHPGLVEAKFVRTLQYLDQRLPQDNAILSRAKSQISTCTSFAVRHSDADRIPVSEWNRACGFEEILKEAESECGGNDETDTPACAAKAVGHLAAVTSKTREIRFAAGLPALETQHQGLCVGGGGF